MADETYEGLTNRETWAVALHINNDQGWQESVFEALKEAISEVTDNPKASTIPAWRAGEIIKANVESALSPEDYDSSDGESARFYVRNILPIVNDIGSLWRVNWTELGASFLSDLAELEQDA